MHRLPIWSLMLVSCLAGAAEPAGTGAGKPGAPAVAAPAQAPPAAAPASAAPAARPQARTPDTFNPSEHISDDSSVSFPVDI
ncbi:MAG: hypothetical protein AB7Q97_20770 [Gammaproteobacteria bacterium]